MALRVTTGQDDGLGQMLPSVVAEYQAAEPEPFALPVPGGVVELHAHGLTTTRYPGLAPVDAVAQDTEDYRATAWRLGYGSDTARMSREHELLRHLLALWLGLPCSPTMRGIALRETGTGPYWPAWRTEEAAVLAVQAFAQACGVDLVEIAKGAKP